MRRPLTLATVALALALSGTGGLVSACGHSDVSASDGRDSGRQEANRQLVLNFYDRFFNKHEVQQAAEVVTDDYRQHNPNVPDGKAPFVSYFAEFFAEHPGAAAKVVRSAVDGDLVYLHVYSINDPQDRGQAVVDIFRVNGGKIVEHWDVIQDVPAESANGNTMF